MVYTAICGGVIGTATVIWLVTYIRKDERLQQASEDAPAGR